MEYKGDPGEYSGDYTSKPRAQRKESHEKGKDGKEQTDEDEREHKTRRQEVVVGAK